MATSYTSNKKIGALDSASTPLAATNEIVINQNGDILKTPLSAVEAKVFDAKTQTTTPTGTEVTIVRQTDGTLRQVPLANIVPALNITNAQISNSAAIVDTKLDTINTAGKVTNNAVQAVSTNTANRIVARDGSGNFAAGTVTATLSGNASTATTLQTGRTIALTGDVTYTSPSFDGSANVTAASTIANNAVTAAKIADGAVTSTKIADGTIVNADINASAAIALSKLTNATGFGLIGKTANSIGSYEEIPAAGDGSVLRRSGASVGFGQIVDAGIASNAAIALSKLATGALPAAITVASDNLVDGTIVNADINASAAIAGTKIAPNFGSQNVVTTGAVGAGTSTITAGYALDSRGWIRAQHPAGDAVVAIVVGNTTGVSQVNFGDTGAEDIGAITYAHNLNAFQIRTNNAERVRIDASGNVGIGTASPSALLDLRGTTSTRINLGVTGTATRAFLDYTEAGYLTTLDADGDIRFSPNNTEVVRIASTGNVGIGTSSPQNNLHISGTSAIIRLQDSDTASNNVNALTCFVRFTDSTGSQVGYVGYGGEPNLSVWNTAASSLLMGTNNTERMRIDASGNVGIGTSSPSSRLHVNGTVTATNFVGPGSVPPGAIMPFAMNSAPSGWLAADGAAVSRSTYAALFAAIGTTHGTGDGSTTFNLPDLQGIFVRGSGSQTISGTTYSGTFAGKQQDQLKSHRHDIRGGTSVDINDFFAGSVANYGMVATGGTVYSDFVQSTGGAETRPANIALLYCIKF